MLDTETRRRIDTARDILVGKVPDPKSQVEQITIALIYKFMDDMDAKAEEFGGERQFFEGEFAQYSWASLMHGGLSGHDVLNLYATAITRMPENPGIPPLFRDIFNNAYLPYRDPETLRAFLKVIDEFTYDHSERLGDAFEYLLSVLGSQGDAGQFRTPRHIIDFIVEIIDPKKNETVLDPACGTAGFLISSWKHIEKAETDENGNSTLTPDDKGRLAQNFSGYDISPDMVRLSLVNMYLHGFAQPRIHEYDALTSEDRWNEFADVILANPPFMSPKGGIRPHNRFSVKSKRSEVLFVDYMAEHLIPEGRAGIIVPEGIIFQSQNAHRQLRKKLVEDYLVAVISLPAGVFNPYSGVKTSILILDRKLAKQTDHIAFFKVENDGFDLGAQRREIEKNDLPMVLEDLCTYLEQSRAGKTVNVPESELTANVVEQDGTYASESSQSSLGLVVEKEKIAADGEYSLGGERYRESKAHIKTEWPIVKLESICQNILSGGTPSTKTEEYWQGNIPWITSADIVDLMSAKPRKHITERALNESATNVIPKGNVIVVTRVGLGKLFRNDFDVCISQDAQGLILKDHVSPEYLVYVLHGVVESFKNTSQGSTIQGVTRKQLAELEVPLPPLKVQQEIVAEIECIQRVIDGARAVIDNYKPRITVDSDWPMVELGMICEVKGGKRLPKGSELTKSPTRHAYIRVSDFRRLSVCLDSLMFITDDVHRSISKYTISAEDVYISIAGTIGLVGTIPTKLDGANLTENAAKLVIRNPYVDKQYLAYIGNSEVLQKQIRSLTLAAGVPKLALQRIKSLKVPLPPLETQRIIVSEIREEETMVANSNRLIDSMNRKIGSILRSIWSEAN